MMKKTDRKQRAPRLSACILLGLAAAVLMLAACALAMVIGVFPDVPLAVPAVACLSAGCLLAAFCAARRSTSRRFFWALAAGGGVLVCLFIFSFLCCDGSVSGPRAALHAGCALAASALGGILGATGRPRKR